MQVNPRQNSLKKDAVCLMVGIAALLGLFPPALHAATPLVAVDVSPDITIALGGETVSDEDVAEDDLGGTVTLINLGTLPVAADVIAYHLKANGDKLLCFDTTVSLPGGLTAGPGDVVRFDGTTFALEFAAANNLPAGVQIDAVSAIGNDLLLSFDVTTALGGLTAEDEDLVRFDGTTFNLFFDGSAAGVPTGLDLDGAHYLTNGHLLLSFDGSGVVDGVAFDDEDVLEYNPVTNGWELVYDGSAQYSGWPAADLDAVYANPDLDGDGIPDNEDACPNSDLRPTVVIEGCDSGVDNELLDDGCTISDLVMECAEGARNHGGYVSCVAHLTNDLKKDRPITGKEKGAIQSCAAQSSLP